MNLKQSRINRTGVATNCLMYMLIRLATQNKESKMSETDKSFTIMNSINRALSRVEEK